jgi:hypothetical protein
MIAADRTAFLLAAFACSTVARSLQSHSPFEAIPALFQSKIAAPFP